MEERNWWWWHGVYNSVLKKGEPFLKITYAPKWTVHELYMNCTKTSGTVHVQSMYGSTTVHVQFKLSVGTVQFVCCVSASTSAYQKRKGRMTTLLLLYQQQLILKFWFSNTNTNYTKMNSKTRMVTTNTNIITDTTMNIRRSIKTWVK